MARPSVENVVVDIAISNDKETRTRTPRRNGRRGREETSLAMLILIGAMLPLFLFFIFSSSQAVGGTCSLDGHFYLHKTALYLTHNIFDLTHTYGAFRFSTAKIIDLAWDVTLGRGGQAMIAYISLGVWKMSLGRFMEKIPVSYDVVIAVTIANQGFSPIIAASKSFKSSQSLRFRFAMGWFVLSAVFVLACPSLMGASTGFSINYRPMATFPDRELVNLTSLIMQHGEGQND